jgi:TonB-linked SusC/RagA family outer membrane protein
LSKFIKKSRIYKTLKNMKNKSKIPERKDSMETHRISRFILVMMLFLFCFTTFNPVGGQNPDGKTISGVVTNSEGEAMIGVSIGEVGSSNGTATDLNGRYSLKISPNSTLRFSYIGYNVFETKVDAQQTNLDVILTEIASELDEVVVVGYGTVKKRDLTGSVASLSADKIMQSPAVTAAQALQGKVPGVLVTNSSWTPGAAPSVLIRGTRSINASNDPLYVVDGIPMSLAPNMIAPGDIESMEVLKDASATAIYGSRGANGVIIITTKKGKKGKIQLDYNGYYGALTIQNKLKLMNAAEYADYVRESYRGAGMYASDIPNIDLDKTLSSFTGDDYTWANIAGAYDENGNYDPSKLKGIDWEKEVERTGTVTDHQLTLRGGSDKGQYVFSTNYYKNEGIYKQQDYERYSFRLNVDAEINSWLRIGGQSSFIHSLQNRGSAFQNTLNPQTKFRYSSYSFDY